MREVLQDDERRWQFEEQRGTRSIGGEEAKGQGVTPFDQLVTEMNEQWGQGTSGQEAMIGLTMSSGTGILGKRGPGVAM